MNIRFLDFRSNDHKARIDSISFLLKNFNCKRIGILSKSSHIPIFNFLNELLSVLTLKSNHDIFFVQFPPHAFEIPLIKIARIKKIRLIFLIHDLDSLRGRANRGLTFFGDRNGYKLLSKGHVIAHSEKMALLLRNQGVNQIEKLEIFDYVNSAKPFEFEFTLHDNDYLSEIEYIFAGNLSPAKSGFIYRLSNVVENLVVYGSNYKGESNLDFRGLLESNFPRHISDKIVFGIVWDGDSAQTLSGPFGKYLEINSPHKASMYLSMGIPIVVSSNSALSPLVNRLKIGFSVDSLHELPESLNLKDYEELLSNVNSVRLKLINGVFLSKVLRSILSSY